MLRLVILKNISPFDLFECTNFHEQEVSRFLRFLPFFTKVSAREESKIKFRESS